MRAAWVLAGVVLSATTAHAQDLGQLVIVSTPSGAEIFVDGKSVGKSPAQAQLLPGDHVVQSKWDDGQQSTETIVAVEAGKSNLVTFKSAGASAAGATVAPTVPMITPAVSVGGGVQVAASGESATAAQAAPLATGASTTTAAGTTTATDEHKLWLGGAVELLPSGSVTQSSGGNEISVGLNTAFAFGALVEYRLSSLISIALAPRYILNVKASSDPASSGMLDIRARVAAAHPVAPRIRAYGFGALGYAFIFLPVMGSEVITPSGLTLTFGGGASYVLGPRLQLSAELGYEIGFETATYSGGSAGFGVNYLHVSGGIAVALGR